MFGGYLPTMPFCQCIVGLVVLKILSRHLPKTGKTALLKLSFTMQTYYNGAYLFILATTTVKPAEINVITISNEDLSDCSIEL